MKQCQSRHAWSETQAFASLPQPPCPQHTIHPPMPACKCHPPIHRGAQQPGGEEEHHTREQEDQEVQHCEVCKVHTGIGSCAMAIWGPS